MFTLLLVFVVVLALFAVMSLMGGAPGSARRRGRTIIIEREAPPVERIVEREVPRRRVVEREYDV